MPRPPLHDGRAVDQRWFFQAPTDDPWDQLRHWAGIARRQWLVMALAWLIVIGAAAAILTWWPRQYQSTAKFLVRNARQELVVNPSSSANAVRMDDVSEETLNSEVELLKSRGLLERVVRELGLNKTSEAGADPSLVLEQAVGGLSGALDIGIIRRTNFIRVAYTDREPAQAATVLRHLVDAYMATHLAVHGSPGTYAFFNEQAAASKEKLDQAQSDLTALAREADLIDPQEQRRTTLQSANELEAQLALLDAQLAENASRSASTQMQMATIAPRILTQERKMPNQQSVERLHTLITELKNKRSELLTKFQSSDRLVLEVNEQLAITETALKEASAMRSTEEATDLNPSWQTLQTERVNVNLSLAGLTSKAERLRKQLAEYRSRAITLNEAVPQYESLTRRVAEARTEHELYAKRAEEARVADALDKQKISNVLLTDAPVASHVPVSPRKKLALVFAMIVAGVLSVVTGLVSEWLRYAQAVRPAAQASYASAPGA